MNFFLSRLLFAALMLSSISGDVMGQGTNHLGCDFNTRGVNVGQLVQQGMMYYEAAGDATNSIERRRLISRAEAQLQEALQLDPEHVEAQIILAWCKARKWASSDGGALDELKETIILEEKLLERKDLTETQRRTINLMSKRHKAWLENAKQNAARRVEDEKAKREIMKGKESEIKAKLFPPLSGGTAAQLERQNKAFLANPKDEQATLIYVDGLIHAYRHTLESQYKIEAKRVLEQLLEHNPKSAGGMTLLGRYADIIEDNPTIAFQWLCKAVEANPDETFASSWIISENSRRTAFINRYNKEPTEHLRHVIEALNCYVPLARRVATNNLIITKGMLDTNAIPDFVVSANETNKKPE